MVNNQLQIIFTSSRFGYKPLFIITIVLIFLLFAQGGLGDVQPAIDSIDVTPQQSLNVFNNLINQGSDKEADLLQNKAMAFVQLVKYDSALFYFNKNLEFAGTENDTVLLTELLNQIADVYFTTGKYSELLATYLKVLKLYEGTDDCDNLCSAIKNVANTHYHLRDKKKSLHWQIRANRMAEECGNEDILQRTSSNIGAIYFETGQSDSAIYYMNQSNELLTGSNNFEALSHSHAILGTVYQLGKDDLEMGLHHYLLAEDYARKSKDDKTVAFALIKLGIYHNAVSEYQNARDYLIQALDIYQNLKLKEGIMYVQSILANSYLGLDNADSVFSILSKKSKMAATVFNENQAAKTAEMETKYETTKKERENELLRKENQLIELEVEKQKAEKQFQVTVLFSIIFILLTIVVFWRYKIKLNQKTELVKLEKLRFQSVIEAEETERVRIAKELHDSLGQLLSTAKLNVAALEDTIVAEDQVLLSNSMNLIDEAVQEVRDISHNMMPNALIRLGLDSAVSELVQKVNNAGQILIEYRSKGMSERMKESVEIAFYRIIQEILNNMIKHSRANVISLDLLKDDNKLFLNISDNGIGFKTEDIESGTGIGWENIFSRVSILNGNIDIKSTPGKGTNIRINISVDEKF